MPKRQFKQLDKLFLGKNISFHRSTSIDENECFFSSWSHLSNAQRAQYLHRIADLVQSRLDDFAKAESIDQGKPLWLARTFEIPRVIENFRFFASALMQSRER